MPREGGHPHNFDCSSDDDHLNCGDHHWDGDKPRDGDYPKDGDHDRPSEWDHTRDDDDPDCDHYRDAGMGEMAGAKNYWSNIFSFENFVKVIVSMNYPQIS